MNNSISTNKNEINVNIPVKAELEILLLTQFLKEYKKLRVVNPKNNYYLIELPKPFVNGNYDPTQRYSIQMGFLKKNNHKIIFIDLDDHQEILSVNNRRKIINFPLNEKKEGGISGKQF